MVLTKDQALDYLASNPDLITKYGLDIQSAIKHYTKYGAKDGRDKNSFNAFNYLRNYSDLRLAFGYNVELAKEHYIKHGFKEGRSDSWEIYQKGLGNFVNKMNNKTNFTLHIIVSFFNAEKYIERCVKSIISQSLFDYKVTIIDDCSEDKSLEKLKPLIENDPRFELKINTFNKKKLNNIFDVLKEKNETPHSRIIILIDGDDYLISNDVLELVMFTYEKTNCLLTYGSYLRESNGTYFGQKYTTRSIYKNEIRKLPFLSSHLKTFRHDLWLNINEDDLKDENGDFFKIADDIAFMFPLLEMAGFRQEQIPDPLYIYNDKNPLNDHKVNLKEQKYVASLLRKKKPYAIVDLP